MNLALLLSYFVPFLLVLFPFSNFVALYSRTDLAKDMCVICLHNLEKCCKIRLRKPMVKMAFLVMLLMCILHGICIARGILTSTCSNVCPFTGSW